MNYWNRYLSAMHNARSRNVPPLPRTLHNLSEVLINYQPLSHLYKGLGVGKDGSLGLIFMHDDIIDPLGRCNHLLGDGIFHVRCIYLFI